MRARGANAIMAAAFESIYGTPPGSGFVRLPFVTNGLAEEQGLIPNDLLGYGRDALPPSLDVANDEGDIVVPVDLRAFGYWLTMAMGAPTTAAALAATGNIVFSDQPADSSTVTINGTPFTFVASGPTGNEVLIGASLTATMTNLAAALNASVVGGVTPATYAAAGGTTLTVTHDTLGPSGNAFTLAADATSNGTVSGATLSGGANTHTFVSSGQTLPSMALEIGMPDVPSYGMNFGARLNTMQIALARSGLLNATLGMIAKGETIGTASTAGALDSVVVERFTQFSGQVKRAGVQLGGVVSANVQYSNNLDKVDTIQPDGRIEGLDPGMVAITGALATRFADHTLLNQAIAGTPVDVSFGWAKAVGKSLLWTNHSVYLPKPKRTIEGPNGVQATFNYQAALDPTLNKMATVVLTNDVASY